MEKIDLNEVRKFYRILSGKEKPESRLDKKLREVEERMLIADLQKDIDDLKAMITESETKDKQPLNIRIMGFMEGIEEKKAHDKEIARIVECLKLNNDRMRKECLRNCKIK